MRLSSSFTKLCSIPVVSSYLHYLPLKLSSQGVIFQIRTILKNILPYFPVSQWLDGQGLIPGMSRSESAISRGNTIMLHYTTCLCLFLAYYVIFIEVVSIEVFLQFCSFPAILLLFRSDRRQHKGHKEDIKKTKRTYRNQRQPKGNKDDIKVFE